jgi:type IV pilus assembly protein PilA
MTKQNLQKGFSLIELLIVVAIILIIAAIAIPNLLRARIAANEASAVGSLRTINTAEINYYSNYQFYSCSLTFLSAVAAPPTSQASGLIDTSLGSGSKSGYTFAATACTPPSPTYQYTAAPISANQTGTRYFCTDSSAVIMYDPTNASTAACLSGGKAL